MAPERIRIRRAAEILGETVRTVQALAARGEIPGAAKPARNWTFDKEKFRSFVRAVKRNKELARSLGLGRRREKKRTYVYYVRGGDFVKIGVAVDVKKRLASLQTSNAVKLNLLMFTNVSIKLERELHAKFAHLREHGEWFRYDPEIERHIYELRHGKGTFVDAEEGA